MLGLINFIQNCKCVVYPQQKLQSKGEAVMFCCQTDRLQMEKRKESLQPKEQYQKRSLQNSNKMFAANKLVAQKVQPQNLIAFTLQLETDVTNNTNALKQFIDRVDNIFDFTEYHKIEGQIVQVGFKSIDKHIQGAIKQRFSIDTIIEQMNQPYYLLVEFKKQLKLLSLSFIYFLQKIQELVDEGMIQEDAAFDRNKKQLREIDPQVYEKLNKFIEQIKLIEKRQKRESFSSSCVRTDIFSVQSDLKNQIQLKNERINNLTLELQSAKTKNQLYEIKFNKLYRTIELMNKNISSIYQKIQIPNSGAATAPTVNKDALNEEKLKKTRLELEFNKSEVARLTRILADLQKNQYSMTSISVAYKVLCKQNKDQQYEIHRLKQLLKKYQSQVKDILRTTETEGECVAINLTHHESRQIPEKNEKKIRESQLNKTSESQFEFYKRQMQCQLNEYKVEIESLKMRILELQSQLIEQKQLVGSIMVDVQEQIRNGQIIFNNLTINNSQLESKRQTVQEDFLADGGAYERIRQDSL